MRFAESDKILVQCDFDGTITYDDVSFAMLDAYAGGDWRQLFEEYEKGRISVGRSNTDAFAMVKANRQSLLEVARNNAKIRSGFQEFVTCCRRKDYRLVIVSNGLDFYIQDILGNIGFGDILVFAARTCFHPGGLKVQYIGPDGEELDDSFKESYVNSFLARGYKIIYVGNGTSDLQPARRCHHIFATDSLLKHCRQTNVACTPFTDFKEIVEVLDIL